jgi:hypothetical protein
MFSTVGSPIASMKYLRSGFNESAYALCVPSASRGISSRPNFSNGAETRMPVTRPASHRAASSCNSSSRFAA